MKLKEDMPLSAAKIEDDTLASGCSVSRLMSFISFYLRMSRRYMKLKEDIPLSAAKIEDDTLASGGSVSRLMSFISLYLHLPPFISLYLHLQSWPQFDAECRADSHFRMLDIYSAIMIFFDYSACK